MSALNFAQKIFLAFVGCIILVIQFIKFLDSDYGFDGTGWVLSLLTSAVLFLPVLSEKERIKNFLNSIQSSNRLPSISPDELNIFSNLVIEDGLKLHSRLVELFYVPKIPLQEVMMQKWVPSCLAFTLHLAAVPKLKRDLDFLNSQTFKNASNSVYGLMVNYNLDYSRKISLSNTTQEFSKIELSVARAEALKELIEVRGLMNKFVSNLKFKTPDPDKEIIGYLIRKTGASADFSLDLEKEIRVLAETIFNRHAKK